MDLHNWRAIAIAGVAALLAALLAAPARAADGADRVVLTGHVLDALARATPDTQAAVEKSDATAPFAITIVMRRSDPAGFQSYLRDVYDPQSPGYLKFLSPAQISDRFGPSAEDAAAVRTYFEQQGLAVAPTPANRMTLVASGPVANVESALAVHIGHYRIGTQAFTANDRDPALPAAIAGRVEAVAGLSSLAVPRPQIVAEVINIVCNIRGFFASFGGGIWGMDAAFKKEYQRCITSAKNGFGAGILTTPDPPAPAWQGVDGTGQTIGIVAFDRYDPNDVVDFINLVGLPASKINNVTRVAVDGGATPGADASEVLLDISLILPIATNAAIRVYDAPSGGGGSYQAVFNAMINDGVTIISNSWAYCEDQTTLADVESIDSILQTAAASGISVLSASGDHGSTCLDGSADVAHVPASSPHVTAVGGTSLMLGPAFTYQSETWWNDSASTPPGGQGGFGTSRFFARPGYQDGATASPMRSIPDVATNADPAQGTMICEAAAGGCPSGLIYGGTSAAAPVWAAYAALLNQSQGSNLGFLNALIYPYLNTPAFHSAASMGTDFAHVGLGSPNLPQLHQRLTRQTLGATSATVSVVHAYLDSNFTMPADSTDGLPVPADGSSKAYIVVRLADAFGNPAGGRTMTLAGDTGSAVISPASVITGAADGVAIFTVTDLDAEVVTFTATDATSHVALSQTAKVAFGVPPAVTAGISAAPTTVLNDGVSQTTITVLMRDALNRPTPGKLVTLDQGSGHSVISGPVPSVTDATGSIQFTATDQYPEAIVYTAVNVTDGNLAVPGSATVTFSGQASVSCASGPAPAAAAGFTLTPFSTGYASASLGFGDVNWGCRGASSPAFGPDGSMYVDQFPDGGVFKLPVTGGTASSTNKLSALGPALFGPVFGKDGRLYASRGATTGDFSTGAIIEIDPATGAELRVVMGNLTCPNVIAVDPLSGDLFTDDICSGSGSDNASLWRISNPASATPTLSVYATLPTTPNGWITIAPDGTIYMPQTLLGGAGAPIVAISGTNKPQPATVTPMPNVTTEYWVTVAETLPGGAAKSLIVSQNSVVRLADITTDPPTYTDLITNGPGSGMIGPDGCLYVSAIDTIYKLAPSSGGCGFAGTSPAPTLTLTPLTVSPNPAQGTTQTLTAQFSNVAAPAGTPVYFHIDGANTQLRTVAADGTGTATLSYSGNFAGTDSIVASALVGSLTLASQAATITWGAGAHATFLNLGLAAGTGSVGRAATMAGTLIDVSVTPNVPVAGATIVFSTGAQSCNGVTDATGVATCTLVPVSAGTLTLTGSYAGDASFLPTSTTQRFLVLGATASVASQPLAIDFGSQTVATTSAPQAATLTNAGTSDFALSSIAISGADAGDFAPGSGSNACIAGGSIAANGGTCVLYLTFTPAATGARTATVTATDSVAGLSMPVSLTGTGALPAAACHSGVLPGGGTGTACVTSALPACQFSDASFVATGSTGTSPPAGVTIPYGLLQFTATGCGSALTLTITYPAPLPAGTAYYKFGPTSSQLPPHWYALPATVSGNTLSVNIADGGAGDDDLAVNGTISDPGGAGFLTAAPAAVSVSTLDRRLLLLVALLLVAAAAWQRRRRQR